MATLTVYSDASDGVIQSFDEDYTKVHAGTGATFSANTTSTSILSGQDRAAATRKANLAYVSFDASSLDDSVLVTDAVPSLYGKSSDFAGATPTLEARSSDWGGTLTTADWLSGVEFAALTLRASFDCTGWSDSAYNDFTDDAMAAAVSKTGITYLVIGSDRYRTETDPTAGELVTARSADTSGTTQNPKLVIDYTTVVPKTKQYVRSQAIHRASRW